MSKQIEKTTENIMKRIRSSGHIYKRNWDCGIYISTSRLSFCGLILVSEDVSEKLTMEQRLVLAKYGEYKPCSACNWYSFHISENVNVNTVASKLVKYLLTNKKKGMF